MERINDPLFTQKYTFIESKTNFASEESALHDFVVRREEDGEILAKIHFQQGPIKEAGVNGVCNEDLLLMVLLRLRMFNQGKFSCRENSMAITKLEEAVMWLRKRTEAREFRGVEGTHEA